MIYIIHTSFTKLCVEKAPECDKCTLWSLRCVDIRLFDPHLHNYVFYLSFSLFSSCDRALISFFQFPIVLKAEDGTMGGKWDMISQKWRWWIAPFVLRRLLFDQMTTKIRSNVTEVMFLSVDYNVDVDDN